MLFYGCGKHRATDSTTLACPICEFRCKECGVTHVAPETCLSYQDRHRTLTEIDGYLSQPHAAEYMRAVALLHRCRTVISQSK